MLARVNEDHMAIGKHPNALAVAVLYAACIREGERITQEQMAIARWHQHGNPQKEVCRYQEDVLYAVIRRFLHETLIIHIDD